MHFYKKNPDFYFCPSSPTRLKLSRNSFLINYKQIDDETPGFVSIHGFVW